jgi:hypothetical protein
MLKVVGSLETAVGYVRIEEVDARVKVVAEL